MKRREFIRKISSASLTATILGATGCSFTPQKPNVLLIVTDDQGYADLGCANLGEEVNTPHMDQLAADGTRFTQAYATSPICSPSRMSITTGMYNERFGTYWYGGKGIHKKRYKTIAEYLKAAHFQTGYIGKVHYGSEDHLTDNRNFPNNHGFDYFYGFTSPRKHYLNHKAALEEKFQQVKKVNSKWGQSLRQQPMWLNKKQVDQEGLSTNLFSDKACQFIENHKDSPFFLQLSFNAVHNFTHQLPKDYLDKHNLKGYHDWNPAEEDYYDWYEKGRYPNNPEGRAHYLGQLYYLDRAIGEVIKKLKTTGIYDNTLIILISDNGGSTPIYADNSPLRGSKYTLYEGGIRVPLIITYPKTFQKGKVRDNMVSGLDILPTICAATGQPEPDYIDGINLCKLLKGQDEALQHKALFWDTGTQSAVRMGKWKYRSATSKKSQDYEMVELELGEYLYNLEKDIAESENLINNYPHIVEKLKNMHKDWKNSVKNG